MIWNNIMREEIKGRSKGHNMKIDDTTRKKPLRTRWVFIINYKFNGSL